MYQARTTSSDFSCVQCTDEVKPDNKPKQCDIGMHKATCRLEQQLLPIQERIWCMFPRSRDLPDVESSGLSERTAWSSRSAGHRYRYGALPWSDSCPRMIDGLSPHQMLEKIATQNEERYEVCWPKGSMMTGSGSPICRTCTRRFGE